MTLQVRRSVVGGLRGHAPGLGPDRYMAPEVGGIADLVASGTITAWAESAAGPLE